MAVLSWTAVLVFDFGVSRRGVLCNARYSESGRDQIHYGARTCCAMSGTKLAYGATRVSLASMLFSYVPRGTKPSYHPTRSIRRSRY
eukprot:566385-Rhodomonas_salina.2